MRIAILTTDTVHHRYFLKCLEEGLGSNGQIVLNIFEQKKYPWAKLARKHFWDSAPNLWAAIGLNPFLQSTSIENRQTSIEKKFFFDKQIPELSSSFPTMRVDSVNNAEVLNAFNTYTPDIGIVYGTGKIIETVFSWPRLGSINAHGGVLPDYRGLDTNFWAIYEGQLNKVGVTIHQMDRDLDTGDILKVSQIPIVPTMSIFSLRCHTTLLCTKLILETISELNSGELRPERQNSTGRYFGPMPVIKKLITNRLIKKL